MRASNELYHLIKALSMQEKRYLKLNYLSTQNKTSIYEKIFDWIVKNKIYDEKKIKEKFKNEGFVKQFNVTKQKLYNIILKGLRNYNSGSTITHRICNGLLNAETLYNKALFIEANNEIGKIKKLAWKREKHHFLPPIIHLERNIFMRHEFGKMRISKIKSIVDEFKEASNITVVSMNYWALKNTLLRAINSKEESEKKYLNIVINSKYFSKDYSLSEDATLNYFLTKIYYYISILDWRTAITLQEKFIQYLKSHPTYKLEHEADYWTHHSNLIVSYINAKKYSKLFELVKNMENLSILDSGAKITQWFMVNYLQFISFINLGKLEKANEFVSEIEGGISKYAHYQSSNFKHDALYQISNLHFKLKKYSKAIKVLNNLLIAPSLEPRNSIRRFSILLLAFSHLEKENFMVSNSLVKEFAKIKITKSKFEELLYQYLTKAIENETNKFSLKDLNGFKRKLNEIYKTEKKNDLKVIFDFDWYLKQKSIV